MFSRAVATYVLIFCGLTPFSSFPDTRIPLIWIRGDQEIGREVSALLKKRGIGLTESESQASLRGSLQRTSDGIAVVLTDESGHWEERLAANPMSVANMIDAWVQDGLLTPNLPSRAVAPETSVGLVAGAPLPTAKIDRD